MMKFNKYGKIEFERIKVLSKCRKILMCYYISFSILRGLPLKSKFNMVKIFPKIYFETIKFHIKNYSKLGKKNLKT